jgi:restriction system protein
MPVPEFNEIKAPALQLFSDGLERHVSEVCKVLGTHFSLTENELSEMLPSGTQSRWHNRASWACYDLFRAGLLNKPKRGVYVISDLGRKIAKEKPENIDRDFLMQFPDFKKWMSATKSKHATGSSSSSFVQSYR